MQLTEAQLAEQLNDRLRMLARSAEAYDLGDYAESTRLAGSIIKIIGDRVRNGGSVNHNFISLSSRLGIKPSFMVDSSHKGAMDQANLHGPLIILGFHLNGAEGLTPILDGFQSDRHLRPTLTPFDKWWNDPVVRDAIGNEFSRRDIVETMRDQEDAHTDGKLESGYAALAYEGSIGITQINLSPYKYDPNPARVVVRQVAHEVLRTFLPDMPPKWVQTGGLKVKPIILYEIQEQDASGKYNLITDHKAIEFGEESTASSEVWQGWSKFISGSDLQGKEVDPPSSNTGKNLLMKLVYLNYAPYLLEIGGTMVSLQHSVD